MSITRRTFLGTLPAGAATLAGCEPETPQSLDQKLIDKSIRSAITVHEPQGPLKKQLEEMASEIHAALPGAIPEAKHIPPLPKLYVQKGSGILLQLKQREHATAIIISEGAIQKLSASEMKGAMAHEIAHSVMGINPQLFYDYQVPRSALIKSDMASKGITTSIKGAFASYRAELCADNLAARITGKPEAMVSLFEKLEAEGMTDKTAPQPSNPVRIEAMKALIKGAPERKDRPPAPRKQRNVPPAALTA